MLTISNPRRGCGTLKRGGFYMQGTGSPDGRLAPWTWLHGTGTDHGANYLFGGVPRIKTVINLPATLASFSRSDAILGAIRPDTIDLSRWLPPGVILDVPDVAVLDHVGSEHYPDPWAFAVETMVHGPSRRITQKEAETMAPYTPLPIVFSHAVVPLVFETAIEATQTWIRDKKTIPDDIPFWTQPSIWQPDWSIYARSTPMQHEHWITALMATLYNTRELAAETHVKPSSLMPDRLKYDLTTTEQVFGVSWITRITYIARPDDTQADLARLSNLGIIPVDLED